MNTNSGVFLGNRQQVAFMEKNALWLSTEEVPMLPFRNNQKLLLDNISGARFLSDFPYGIYLAFWSFTWECFRLTDITGNELCYSWMNSDKWVPDGVYFSNSGDAVGCFFYVEPLSGIFFCDIDDEFSTIFGCSGCPFGFDADLRYFAKDSCNTFEDENLAFYINEADTDQRIKISPEVISQILKESPLLRDRIRCILSKPVIPVRGWQGLAIREELSGLVILKDCNLYWFNGNSADPETIIKQCIPENDCYKSYCTRLHICGDNVLIHIGDHEVVVNRNRGVIFSADKLSSVDLKENRILAHYSDGNISVFGSDGSEEIKCPPLRGFKTLGLSISKNLTKIAYAAEMSGNIVLKTYELDK